MAEDNQDTRDTQDTQDTQAPQAPHRASTPVEPDVSIYWFLHISAYLTNFILV
jgi:hypothetical protein